MIRCLISQTSNYSYRRNQSTSRSIRTNKRTNKRTSKQKKDELTNQSNQSITSSVSQSQSQPQSSSQSSSSSSTCDELMHQVVRPLPASLRRASLRRASPRSPHPHQRGQRSPHTVQKPLSFFFGAKRGGLFHHSFHQITTLVA